MLGTAPLLKTHNQPGEKRCSDYDADCAAVACHISCWLGGRRYVNGVIYETPPADGFCPYLRPVKGESQ